MGERATLFRGIIRNGMVLLDPTAQLPEGAEVEVKLSTSSDERAESEAWEALSDEAWSQIDWGEGEIARDSG